MPVASLMMYDRPDAVQRANDALWIALRDRLRARGLDVPDLLDRAGGHDSYWLRPDLVFGQTCGYPYVRQLRGRVRLVATPVFSHPGGRGARRASFLVTRESDPARDIADLAGRRAAINDWLSNSGMNLLRIAAAPHARDGRFFSEVVVTGGHMASIAAIREGRADTAAIDSITWSLHRRHAPETLSGIRIVGETPLGPGLPYITRLSAGDAEIAVLREELAGAVADRANAVALDTLGLTGIEVLSDADYTELEAFEDEARRLGYPKVA
ncbi:MAG: PhnD/SsuA/transferrin family substrate-binding protein [Rhizobiaceae bacterium]|nr:PhnD/SsuA/transferrin family substrate-binding protein [Rhizobiaceae bacterium]